MGERNDVNDIVNKKEETLESMRTKSIEVVCYCFQRKKGTIHSLFVKLERCFGLWRKDLHMYVKSTKAPTLTSNFLSTSTSAKHNTS